MNKQEITSFVDNFLNSITMYRLMLYFLIFLFLIAVILSIFGLLPFNPIALLFSTAFLTAVCWITNTVFAKVFKVPTNLESVYITALILTLIITPRVSSYSDVIFFTSVAILAMASKYILAINRKHIFNPAAFAVFLTAVTLNFGASPAIDGASWWVGNWWMMPFVAIAGLLILKKIKRSGLVLSFIFTAMAVSLGTSILRGNDPISIAQIIIIESPILFFAFVMLTEPQTTPPTQKKQIIYGSLVGLLFAAYVTPEIALLIGNLFSYLVSPKGKLLLKLKEKLQIAPDIYDFVFNLDKKFTFSPGQYMEWTLGHHNPDSRGVRRYFTIAASPTEGNLRIGIKFSFPKENSRFAKQKVYPNGSSFKKVLLTVRNGDQIVASQLAGEFTLPEDSDKKLCFIAGGIGITPFRSILKFLLDTKQKRDIILLYSNKLEKDIVYKDIFDEAFQKLGIRTVYVLTDTANVSPGWNGRMGYIDARFIWEEIPDYKDRIFFISGPHSMVDVFENTLKGIGLSGKQIKVDFFPGYA